MSKHNERSHSSIHDMLLVILVAGIVGLTFGYTLPLLSLIMERDSIGPTLIGISAATESAAILLIGPLVPGIIRALGLRRIMSMAIIVAIITLCGIGATDPLLEWFPLRFVLGGAIFIVLIASDIWITEGATKRRRGLMLAIYGTSVTTGIAIGPLLVPLVSDYGSLSILIGAIILASSLVPLILVNGFYPTMQKLDRKQAFKILKAIPIILTAALVFGMVDSSVLSLLPVFGLHLGIGEDKAVQLVSFFVAGAVFLQLPIGWLSDQFGRQLLIQLCALSGGAASITFYFVTNIYWASWGCLFIIGGTSAALYTVSLAKLGDSYSGGNLATAISIIAMIFAVGSTAGPIVGGIAISLWDPYGLNMVIIGSFVLVCLASILVRSTKRTSHSNT